MRWWFLVVVAAFLLLPSGVDAKHVIINSADWRDVYTGMLYASLEGHDSLFFRSEYDADSIISRIPKVDPSVILIESELIPFVPGFDKELENEGFTVQKVVSTTERSANIQLAEDAGKENFVIIGSAYGYDAISVAPYASMTKSYVFLVGENAEEIVEIIRRSSAKNVLIYGYIDPEVKALFDEFDPEIIDEGDKFLDNIKIVSNFIDRTGTTQAHITSGEFLEVSLFNPHYPTIFIGKDSVPEQTMEFIKEKITVGILVGNELFIVANEMKEEIKKTHQFSLIVKFGRGSGAGGATSLVQVLDMFVVPSPATNISVESVKYNLFTHQLEVVYRNNENTPTYFKSVITIFTDGVRKRTLGDEEIRFIGPLDTAAVGYDIDLGELLDARMVMDVRIYTQYGAGVVSLTNVYEETFRDIQVFSAEERSQGGLTSVVYNTGTRMFEVTVENLGDQPFYYKIDLLFMENEQESSASMQTVQMLGGKSSGVALIPYDVSGNIQTVTAVLRYGERADFLSNSYEKEFLYSESAGLGWLWIILLLIIVLIALYIIYRRFSDW